MTNEAGSSRRGVAGDARKQSNAYRGTDLRNSPGRLAMGRSRELQATPLRIMGRFRLISHF